MYNLVSPEGIAYTFEEVFEALIKALDENKENKEEKKLSSLLAITAVESESSPVLTGLALIDPNSVKTIAFLISLGRYLERLVVKNNLIIQESHDAIMEDDSTESASHVDIKPVQDGSE